MEDMGMRNRVVRRLLMVCMAMALTVSMPMASWAADSQKETSEENNSDDIVISKNGADMVLYKDKKLSVEFGECTYTKDASDAQFTTHLQNDYPNIFTISFDDVKVDGSALELKPNSGEYKAGNWAWSSWRIDLETLQTAGLTDFKEMTFTVKGTLNNGTDLFEKNVTINRDAFKSLADETDNSEDESTEETTEESISEETAETSSSTDDEKYDELLQRMDELEEKNKELEDKNKELEDKLSQSEEEKKQEETEPTAAPTETVTPEPTETPAEDTPAPEPTEEPAQEEAAPEAEQKPVVEYKDATTIRIVQQALNDAGYNCGNPDGVAGGKTTEAVTKYQTDKGLTVNGLVTDELLQALNVVDKVQDAVQKEASKGEYGADYSYDQLARNPDTYKNQKIKISGKVLQAEYDDDICYARIAMNNDYNTVVFVTYSSDLLNYRLLEDDKVTVYGVSYGVYSYKAVSGATITIPWLNADMIEM